MEININKILQNNAAEINNVDSQIQQFVTALQDNTVGSDAVKTAIVLSQGLREVVAVQSDTVNKFKNDFIGNVSDLMKQALTGKLTNLPAPPVSAPPAAPTPTSGGITPT